MSFTPQPGEKVLFTEDCAEDNLKNGVLILTNKRILFQKTEGQMATLSKKAGNIIFDISLDKVSSFKPEGFLVKKIVIIANGATYKFGVFSTGQWYKRLKEVIPPVNP